MHLQSYTPLLNSPPLFDKNSNKDMESNILQISLRIQVLFVRVLVWKMSQHSLPVGYAGMKQVKARDRCEIYLHDICTACRRYRAV